MLQRPRRNRASAAIRGLTREVYLAPGDFVWPMFIQEGDAGRHEIASMPGIYRYCLQDLLHDVELAMNEGIMAVALFPALEEKLKDSRGTESLNPNGLLQRTVRALKKEFPELCVITDVALDPYSSDGHDGFVKDGKILNDETLFLLASMAVSQAEAGADVVAPSDMMDGRVQAIRESLDKAGHTEVGICSYCVKYASAFYGPFRDALDSAPKAGDKKTYQMNPAGGLREIAREIALDEAEGADWLMVKPGLPYLDVVRFVRDTTVLPISAYHVSGEYASLIAAARNGWLAFEPCLIESLISLRRAGADMIFTYGALEAAKIINKGGI